MWWVVVEIAASNKVEGRGRGSGGGGGGVSRLNSSLQSAAVSLGQHRMLLGAIPLNALQRGSSVLFVHMIKLQINECHHKARELTRAKERTQKCARRRPTRQRP